MSASAAVRHRMQGVLRYCLGGTSRLLEVVYDQPIARLIPSRVWWSAATREMSEDQTERALRWTKVAGGRAIDSRARTLRIGLLEERLGDYAAAQETYGRLPESDIEALYRLGRVLEASGELEKAAISLLGALRLDPTNVQAEVRLKALIGRAHLTEHTLDQVLEWGVGSSTAPTTWISARDARHRSRHSVNAAPAEPNPRDLLSRSYRDGLQLMQKGKRDAARDAFSRALSHAAPDIKARGLAALHGQQGNWEYAAAVLEEGERSVEMSLGEYYFQLGYAYDNLGRWETARNYYGRALGLEPKRLYTAWRLGAVSELSGDYESALAAYAEVVHLGGPSYHKAAYRAARMCLELSQVDRAFDFYGLMGSTRVRASLERLFLPVVASDLASTPRQAAGGVAKMSIDDAIDEVEVMYRSGTTHQAVDLLERAIIGSRSHPTDLYYMLGRICALEGRTQNALEAFSCMEIEREASAAPHVPKVGRHAELLAQYAEFYETLPLEASQILFESSHGESISCNPVAIFRAVASSDRFAGWRLVWAYKSGAVIPDEISASSRIVLVEVESTGYARALATSGILVNNTSFPTWFIRRDKQVYLNTWHGTPLKQMGIEVNNEVLKYGNIARNLLQASHLALGNTWTRQLLQRTHLVDGLITAEVCDIGSPRNDVFGAEKQDSASRLAEAIGAQGQRPIAVYAPTWRGSLGSRHEESLSEGYVGGVIELLQAAGYETYYSAHRFAAEPKSEIVRSALIPSGVDLYDVLAVADLLVTDFSSVYFDFLNSGRPVVFTAPDREQYRQLRGVYDIPSPGPWAQDLTAFESVLASLNSDNASAYWAEYGGIYEQQQREYGSFDPSGATAQIVEWLLGSTFEESDEGAGAPVARVFHQSLIPNGIAKAFGDLAAALDERGELTVLIGDRDTTAKDPARMATLQGLGDRVRFLPRVGRMVVTSDERFVIGRESGDSIDVIAPSLTQYIDRAYAREARRLLGTTTFRASIEFDGYASFWARIMLSVAAERHVLWLHNEMSHEVSEKFARTRRTLELAPRFDSVVSVSESVRAANSDYMRSAFGVDPSLSRTVHNPIDAESIRRSAEEPAELPWRGSPRLLVLARLSVEKGHDRVLRAFKSMGEKYPEAHLVLAGDGPLRERLTTLIEELGLEDSVTMLGHVSNPQPLVASADALLLLSRWEGLGLVLLEAMVHGVPVVATEIPGPASLLSRWGGTLVSDSDEGVREALEMALAGSLQKVDFDAELYRAIALAELDSVL